MQALHVLLTAIHLRRSEWRA